MLQSIKMKKKKNHRKSHYFLLFSRGFCEQMTRRVQMNISVFCKFKEKKNVNEKLAETEHGYCK